MHRTIRFFLVLPFRAVRSGWRLAATLLLVASLMFNIAVFAVQGLFAATAGALSAAGVTTAVVREAGATRSRQNVRRDIGRQTSQRVTRRLQRSTARSIASAAGEAIPFIGVGVIVGAVALEVKDACDTARDMAGLEAALIADGDPELAKEAAENAFDCTAMIREGLPGYDDLPTREAIWDTVRASPRQAWETARDADVAVADVDWSGWGTAAVTRAVGLLDRVGGSDPDKEPVIEE